MTGRFRTLSFAALLLFTVMLCSCAGPILAIVRAIEGDDNDKHDPVTLLVPQEYATIQEAIDAAFDGDTVLVADGTYTGPGNKDLMFGKPIILRSENGPENCIIDCENDGRGVFFPHIYMAPAGTGVFDGFTVTNGNNVDDGGAIFCGGNFVAKIINCIITDNAAMDKGGGIFCDYDANIQIINCTITNNTANSGGGIRTNRFNGKIERCIISGNTADRGGGGMQFWEGGNPEVTSCLIVDNIAQGNYGDGNGGAISCFDSNPTFLNCTIGSNTAADTGSGWYAGGGVYCDLSSSPVFSNCILWGNTATDGGNQIYTNDSSSTVTLNTSDCLSSIGEVEGAGTVTRDVNIGVDPLFVDAAGGNYELQSSSPCIDAGDNGRVPPAMTMDVRGYPRFMDGDRGGAVIVDIGAYEFRPRVYVDDTGGFDINEGEDWANAVKSIRKGLEIAQDWWVVLVADGTYSGLDNRFLDFAGKSVTLESVSGAASCIIDCQDSGRAFRFHHGEDGCSVLDGFTITDGDSSENGGGILCESSSPTITNCIIDNCTADQGGAIACDNNSCPVIKNCTISNSFAGRNGGGVFCSLDSCPTIDNCTVYGNSAGYGAGIYCERQSDPTITNCVIRNNSGYTAGGIHCQDSCPEIINCEIRSNSATGTYGGGIRCQDASPSIVNCKITDNTSFSDGAGIFADKCFSTISNCTIANNDSSTMGGGVFFIYSSPTLDNTIIWGNSASTGNQIYIYDSDTDIVLNYCDFAAGVGEVDGPGTVTVNHCKGIDPLFVNAAGDDYHLQAGSSCIDAGDNSLIPVGVTKDLDGNARISNGTVDMGAYEYQP